MSWSKGRQRCDGRAKTARARRCRRLPLAFFIGHYFVYILLCALLFAGVPTAMFSSAMSRGIIYQANWAANNARDTLDALSGDADPGYDLDCESGLDIRHIPACYDYAVVDADASRVTDVFQSFSDVRNQALAVVRGRRDAGLSREGDAGNLMRDGVYYDAAQLPDGGWCVLAWDYMPRWADRDRAGWINPQDLWLGSIVLLMAASVLVIALRASRVLTRKMVPLVDVAEAVGARSLDFQVPNSNVVQVDDVLAAMDRMRVDLKAALEEQWETEAAHRRAVTQTVHELKTPLTALYGNADLLLEEYDRDPRAFTPEQREELEALRAAARDADAVLLKLIDATRGMTAPE